MGNQNSRLERRLGSTASQDARMTSHDWLLTSSQDPYQRRYPLPLVSSSHRLKLRKHSSPLTSTTTTYPTQRPLSRVFRPFNKTPASSILTPSLHPLVCENESTDPPTLPDIKHDLLLPTTKKVNYIDGRKFHTYSGSSYILPCDEEEIDRLHLLHFMVRFAIQGNYLAPVTDCLRKGAQVLDIGCGPGSWTMEMAGEYPKSTIIGVDMNNMFPRDIKPTNCQFYQCDILKGLPFEDETFDYVFMRFMGEGIGLEQWDPLIKDILRVLKPGGWMEVVEMDLELYRIGPNTKIYNDHLINLMTTRQLDPYSGRRLKERFEKRIELININTTFISCPGGQWAGKLGQLTMQSWKSYYLAIQPQVCLATNLSVDEYNDKLDLCWDEANDYKTFENVHFAFAQKQSS